jgi:hypothetical protein
MYGIDATSGATGAMKIRRIALIPHTHHDVGYTNSPRIVDRLHREIVGEVVRLAGAYADPGPAQFRWTFEVARPVVNFLRHAPAGEVAALRRLVEAGRISVTGGYLNMTQLPSAAELDAGYEAVAELRAAGLAVRTEQHGDVNGLAWGAVEAMRRAGLTRLVMALNPDHGRAPFTQPTGFWWESASGARVFAFLSTHYGIGEEWGIVDGDTGLAVARIADFVKQLEARVDYPYDTAVVHAANDNRWPTARFLDVVRAWNAARPDLPMHTATVDETLDRLEAQARAVDVPVARGEWSDWWAHGHGSTAREVAVYREARSFSRAAATMAGLTRLRGDGAPATAEVIGYRRGPVRLRPADEVVTDLAAVDEQLLLFGEHTWGSWETYARPHSTFSHSHRNASAAFAYEAYDLARDLAVEMLFRFAASGGAAPATGPAVLVANPSERPRREPVEVEVDGRWRARTVAAAPAFGTALVPVPEPPVARRGREITKGHYRVAVDPGRGGVVSLVDLRTGRELVDGDRGHGLATVVVEQVAPGASHPMLDENPKFFRPENPGPEFVRAAATGDADPEIEESAEFARISWLTAAPGVPEVRTTLTVHADHDAVDVEVRLVKPARPGPESVFVAFPFAVRSPRFLMETAGAVYEAEREQLPDTSKDWYSIQHAVGVTGEEHGILWGSYDAPLVQVGGFHTGTWARRLDVAGGSVNSWLMNNLHFTNFQAQQDGTRRYRYRFTPVPGPVSSPDVQVYGRDLLEPLCARWYTGPVAAGPSGLAVEPDDRVLAEVRPAAGSTVRVRLRNPAPTPVEAIVSWTGPGSPAQRETTTVPGHAAVDVLLSADR